ncbi:hypothetical protein HMPREF3219_0200219 [Streptococcus salivarius]|nr:hypothetical protein HMPREF3219_0200219 [Streptococcus salivarius]
MMMLLYLSIVQSILANDILLFYLVMTNKQIKWLSLYGNFSFQIKLKNYNHVTIIPCKYNIHLLGILKILQAVWD